MLEETVVSAPHAMFGDRLGKASKVVSGGYFSAALLEDGSVFLRGMGGPRRIPGPWQDLAAGSYQLYLLSPDGLLFSVPDVRVQEWVLEPVHVPFPVVRKLLFASGHDFTVIVDPDQTFVVERNTSLPTPPGAKSVCCGGSYAMLLTDGGELFGLGSNAFGQLAQANDVRRSDLWLRVPLSAPVESVACGGDHVVALAADGRVFAWGWSEKGQIGIGQLDGVTQVHKPKWISALSNVKSVAAGGMSSVTLFRAYVLTCVSRRLRAFWGRPARWDAAFLGLG